MKLVPLVLLLLLLPNPQAQAVSEIISHDVNVEIVIDSSFDSPADIMATVDKLFSTNVVSRTHFRLTLTHNFTILDSSKHDAFVQYLKSIEESGAPNGHSFNKTAYDLGRLDQVFPEVSGRSYDVEKAYKWLENNLWDGRPNQYSFYIFNLTELDTDSLEHWFTYRTVDIDSGNPVTSFFSRTRGLTHGRQVSGWGGQSAPLQFVDLSARTWFQDFINGVWGYSESAIGYTLADIDPSASNFSTWVSNYVRPYVNNLWLEPTWTPDWLTSITSENVVIANWSRLGYSPEDLGWILDIDYVEEELNSSFPWIEFSITESYYSLGSFPDIQQEMNKYMVNTSEGYILELNSGFLTYLENSVIPVLFGQVGPGYLPSLSFLLDGVTLSYGGTKIAGLGGMGWQLQGLQPERVFNETGHRERGLSLVATHEIGHSLGLPHPFFNYGEWSSDYVASVMGYYTNYPHFSIYDKIRIGRVHATSMLYNVTSELESFGVAQPRYSEAEERVNAAYELLNMWDFSGAIMAAKEAHEIMENPENTNVKSKITIGNTSNERNFSFGWVYFVTVVLVGSAHHFKSKKFKRRAT